MWLLPVSPVSAIFVNFLQFFRSAEVQVHELPENPPCPGQRPQLDGHRRPSRTLPNLRPRRRRRPNHRRPKRNLLLLLRPKKVHRHHHLLKRKNPERKVRPESRRPRRGSRPRTNLLLRKLPSKLILKRMRQ